MTQQHPRLKVHVRRRANGKVATYYVYDMRSEGLPDIPLGRDYDLAIKRWKELREGGPRVAGTIEEAFASWEKAALPSYSSAETRRGYTKSLRQIRPVFGGATWESVKLVHLKAYLKKRTAKTQGNRELALLSVIWNWARGEGLTDLPWPAAGMEKARWKNKEKARHFEVTDELFAAVYAEADQILRDAMDIATATGMRLTDVRTILMPAGDKLRLLATKTEKAADFDISMSQVLPDLVDRRRAMRANHLMLLSTPTGKPVSYGMLRTRWDDARAAAADKADEAGNPALAAELRRMYLRDMRKRAADLADDLDGASELLQHSSKEVTRRHYRTRATSLKPVR